jgi:hypothetical protein
MDLPTVIIRLMVPQNDHIKQLPLLEQMWILKFKNVFPKWR